MALTNKDRILAFLTAIAPDAATNAMIVSGTRITPHQQVFQITRQLAAAGTIRGRQIGRECHFSYRVQPTAAAHPTTASSAVPVPPAPPNAWRSTAAFEPLAKDAMRRHFGVEFSARRVPGVPKLFDLVSDDGQIVGDAKYYSLVNRVGTPPAKFSIIAEHVWLLEKTCASRIFLVFGNDRRVPEAWLKTYGVLAKRCEFHSLTDRGQLDSVQAADAGPSAMVTVQQPSQTTTS